MQVFEAARHPVPHFEGVPARTNVRLKMSPSTPYWEKPEVLREAEDWEEDRRQRQQVRGLVRVYVKSWVKGVGADPRWHWASNAH